MKNNIIVVDDIRNLSDYDLSDLIETIISKQVSSTYPGFSTISIEAPYIGLYERYSTRLRELFILTHRLPQEENRAYKKSTIAKYIEALKISHMIQKKDKNNIDIEGNRKSINHDDTLYIVAEGITLFDALEEGDRRIKSAIGYAKHPDKYEDLSNCGTTEIIKRKSLKKSKV